MKVEELVAKDEGGYAVIKCSSCLLWERFPANALTEPVDVYGDFIDKYYEEVLDEPAGSESVEVVSMSLEDIEKESSKVGKDEQSASAGGIPTSEMEIGEDDFLESVDDIEDWDQIMNEAENLSEDELKINPDDLAGGTTAESKDGAKLKVKARAKNK